MISGVVNYLNDPHLVTRIQKYFGVSYVKNKCKTEIDSEETNHLKRKHVTKSNNLAQSNGIVSSGDGEETISSESDVESVEYVINNKFWYFLFIFGTELGDELFYATFIPFWFWNVDGAVGRRVVLVWAIIMYIGQGIKDIVCWPRPSSPPVIRLQKKWVLEYGMPSTHAMVGVSIPFSVVLYTMGRYQYPVWIGWILALLWTSVVSVSRLYLGMHSVLDIIAGLCLALALMVVLIPAVDHLDSHILTSHWSPIILLAITISLIIFYPKFSKKWTPTRGDTTVVLSVMTGVQIGAWANYHLGQMTSPTHSPPYAIIWPSYEMIGLCVLRSAIGFSCILATRAICKSASYATLCFFLQLDSAELRKTAHITPSSTKNTIELTYKYITYALIGFNIVYMLPTVFKLLRIDRPTFYTEL